MKFTKYFFVAGTIWVQFVYFFERWGCHKEDHNPWSETDAQMRLDQHSKVCRSCSSLAEFNSDEQIRLRPATHGHQHEVRVSVISRDASYLFTHEAVVCSALLLRCCQSYNVTRFFSCIMVMYKNVIYTYSWKFFASIT